MQNQTDNKFIIPIQSLLEKELGATEDFVFELANYPFPRIIFPKRAQLTGTITYLEDALMISFESSPFTCQEQCGRCLTECDQITTIDAALESFSLHTPAENDFALLEQREDGSVLDITPLVEQELLLSFRHVPLCKDDCLGLCPQCGTDLNRHSCECSKNIRSDNPFDQLKSLFPPK